MDKPLEFRPGALALVAGILVGIAALLGQLVGVQLLLSGAENASLGWWIVIILLGFDLMAVQLILGWKNCLIRVTDDWIEVTDALGRVHGPISWDSIDRITYRNPGGAGGTYYTLYYEGKRVTFRSGFQQWGRLKSLLKGHLRDRWPRGPTWF